ncbi:MAG: transglycosylase domain-containing protein [Polyangia bacterium]
MLALVIAVLLPYPVERLSPDRDAPLVITDRHGEVLRTVASSTGRRETWLSLDEVPSLVLLSIIASEDAGFFEHGGVDPRSLGRAAWLDVKARRYSYGGSTLSMQLARLVRPELAHKALFSKLRQSIDALRLERALTKREIVEQYVNRAYFGNGAVGLEAAAQTYFGKPARALGSGEAVLLATLPRAPTYYDPLKHLDAALTRRAHVLQLLVEHEIMSAEQRRLIEAEPVLPSLHRAPSLAPHFVDFAIAQLPFDVRAHGGRVRTTLDLALQRRLEHRLVEQVASLHGDGLHQAGALVLDTAAGEILALVGSADYEGVDGQLDIAATRRHPGSALKPFVYATAIEQGGSPASIAVDVSDVPSDYRLPHASSADRGPLRYREALAGSYNLAAVHVLEELGIDRVLGKLRVAGLGALSQTPDEYGLRLALGSAPVRLVDLAAAYGFLVRDGNVTQARAVLSVERTRDTWHPAPRVEHRVFSAEASWLVMDMLADPDARRARFGDELPLDLPFHVAAKTGTSRGFADTVAIGVTREYTVAAWGGNFDGRPTHGLVAMQSAAPLVRAGLLGAADGHMLTLPEAPSGIVRREVCALSGLVAGAHCTRRKLESFAATVPPKPCTWHDGSGTHLPALYARWQARTTH